MFFFRVLCFVFLAPKQVFLQRLAGSVCSVTHGYRVAEEHSPGGPAPPPRTLALGRPLVDHCTSGRPKAGCRRSVRRSTNGGVFARGSHCLNSWSEDERTDGRCEGSSSGSWCLCLMAEEINGIMTVENNLNSSAALGSGILCHTRCFLIRSSSEP